MTRRLYFDDPLLTAFDAAVERHDAFDGWASVVLDRTAFYPEAGGQMADRGTLTWGGAALEVTDVQAEPSGVVHHRLDPATRGLPPIGARVTGAVDLPRRRAHMSLHTGQHMLSRALLDEAGAPTISARLGETACTIDLDAGSIAEVAAQRAEDLVNAVIDDDRTVRAYFPQAEDLPKLALRRAPKVERDVRVVDVDGFDVTPCGGTHCTRTSQVGLVKIVGLERYKGKVRITFVAGSRARGELGRAHGELARLARELTCGMTDVAGAVARLKADLAASREAGRQLAAELGRRIGEGLASEAGAAGEELVVRSLPGADVELLRAVATAFKARVRGAVVLAGQADGDGCPIVVSRHAAFDLDCGALLRKIATTAGGRGGGRADHAEGRLPRGADIAEIVRRLRA